MGLGYKSTLLYYDTIETLKHFPALYNENKTANVEIHRIPVHQKDAKQFSTSLLFRDRKKSENNETILIPSDEHRLIHTFIHSQLGNNGHLLYLPGFRDMYDAWLLSKRVNLEEVIEQIEEKEKARIFFEYVQYLFSPDQDLSIIKNKSTVKLYKSTNGF